MEFGLIEPRGFMNIKLFQVVVRGQIAKLDNRTTVNIKLRLSWYTLGIFSMLYLMSAFMISAAIVSGDLRAIGEAVLWVLVFPVLGTFLLHRRLNMIEKKVEDLFDFNEQTGTQSVLPSD
jgi:hypothetical protein